MVASYLVDANESQSAVYYLLVHNPSRPCLTPERRFHLSRTRSLSPTSISHNQTYLSMSTTIFNPALQTPDFLRSILHFLLVAVKSLLLKFVSPYRAFSVPCSFFLLQNSTQRLFTRHDYISYSNCAKYSHRDFICFQPEIQKLRHPMM